MGARRVVGLATFTSSLGNFLLWKSPWRKSRTLQESHVGALVSTAIKTLDM